LGASVTDSWEWEDRIPDSKLIEYASYKQPNLGAGNGAFAQVISYLVSIAWPSLRRLGCPTDKLPIAIIASKMNTTAVANKKSFRWVGGNVFPRRALRGLENSGFVFFPEDLEGWENDNTIPVLIKVSSSLAHDLLVACNDSFTALKDMKLLQVPDLREGEVDKVRIPYALIAAKDADGGLVTIMEDLSSSHERLEPKKLDAKLSLWTAFQKLLMETLIPAAAIKVIFCDLRAGYDLTANILVAKDEKGIRLELIDFDSFVQVQDYAQPRDRRYLRKYSSACTFVFVQVLVLGMTWKNNVEMEKVNFKEICEDLEKLGLVTNFVVHEQDILCLAHYFKWVFEDNNEAAYKSDPPLRLQPSLRSAMRMRMNSAFPELKEKPTFLAMKQFLSLEE
jgi:hypothetical protein